MRKVYDNYVKRVVDILLSAILLMMLSPLLIVVLLLLAVYNKNCGPLFFQPRVGYRGNIFYIIKFRTMHNGRDINGHLLTDEERVTPVGRIIRCFSIDELPQLINVLKGDMSIVGPRPLLAEYIPLYTKEQNRRHNVRPGITGWAQINGRNRLDWNQRFSLDVWYVDNLSLELDLKIMVKTISCVLQHKDTSYDGEETMHFFNGFN